MSKSVSVNVGFPARIAAARSQIRKKFRIAVQGTRWRLSWAPVLLALLGVLIVNPAKAQGNWVYESGGAVPSDAISGGMEPDGTPLYICRAFFQGGVHPGRVRPGLTGCNIGWGTLEYDVPFYQVLVPLWASAANGNIPPGAYSYGFEAGFFGPALYPCRGYLNGGLHPGKVRPGFIGCNIGWGGKEVPVNPYEVLIAGPYFHLPVDNWPLAAGSLPVQYGPVVGGFEADGQPLYVCLAGFNNGNHPGKFRPGLGGCNIGWGGAEQSVPTDQSSVMILNWMRPTQVSFLSFQAGNEANGDGLSICRANVNDGGLYPGKYSWSLNACSIGLNGAEVLSHDFLILTDNTQIPH